MAFKQLYKEIQYFVIALLKVGCEPGRKLRGCLILSYKLGNLAPFVVVEGPFVVVSNLEFY